MINLELLPEEHRLMSDAVKRFADEVIRPQAEKLDEEESFPADIYAHMAQLGLFGITVPAEYGGAGMDHLAYAIVMEQLSRGYSSVADQCGLLELVGGLLTKHGSDEQRKQWMQPLLKAEKRGAYCITEAEAGSDVSNIRSTAKKKGDGWVLNGAKLWIHNAPVADVAFVLARTDPEAGHRGMSVFIVDCSLKGVSKGPKEHKMGQRASQVGEIVFDNVELGKDALLGEEGRGFYMMMASLDTGRIGIAALAVGIAQAALEACLIQAKERRQFGSAIAELQAVQLLIADIAKDSVAARELIHAAARKLDAGGEATAYCSMAKCFASDMAVAQTANAVQVFGGSGYIRGFEVERLYRDAKITQIYEGTNQIQRLVIARKLLAG